MGVLPLCRWIPALLFACLSVAVLTGCAVRSPALPLLPPDAVILAFGDSLTRGTGAGTGQSYPEVLAGLTGLTVISRGVPGELSAAGAARLPRVLDEVGPDLLLLCHGGNDMLRKLEPALTRANLRRMIDAARERGVPVVLIGVPKPGLFLRSAEFYQELATEYDLPYLDQALADILADRGLKADAVHPNAEGYGSLARAVQRTLIEAGALL